LGIKKSALRGRKLNLRKRGQEQMKKRDIRQKKKTRGLDSTRLKKLRFLRKGRRHCGESRYLRNENKPEKWTNAT